MTKKRTPSRQDDDVLEEDISKELDIEDIDLGDELTAGDIPERYYKHNSQKAKDDARKSFERDYNDVMDYEE